VVFAADYPFLEVLGTMLIFFVWVSWFWLVIRVGVDIFRRRDVRGGKKVMWIVFVLFVPLIGVFAYLLANGDGLSERDAREAELARAQFDDRVRSVANNGGAVGDIDRAKQLLDNGAITAAEFDALKAKALA